MAVVDAEEHARVVAQLAEQILELKAQVEALMMKLAELTEELR